MLEIIACGQQTYKIFQIIRGMCQDSKVHHMVWGAVCKRGKLPLVFIGKGVKINAEYYKTEVLDNILLQI